MRTLLSSGKLSLQWLDHNADVAVIEKISEMGGNRKGEPKRPFQSRLLWQLLRQRPTQGYSPALKRASLNSFWSV